jgi:hypothetical protein
MDEPLMVIAFDHHIPAVPGYPGDVTGVAAFDDLPGIRQCIYLLY